MEKKLSLRQRLLKYLVASHGYISSGDLQRLVVKYTAHTPRSAVRRLEELCEDGFLDVQYRKGHAFYKVKDGVEVKLPNPEHVQGVGRLPSYSELVAAGKI